MLEKLFDKAVKRYFGALAAQYHLEESSSEVRGIAKFENENIVLQVSFDSRRSYEMSVLIYNKKPSSKHSWDSCLNLYSIMKLRAPRGYKYEIQTSNPEFVDEAIKNLSQYTETYASDLLRGDIAGFQEVAAFQKKQSYEYNLKRDLCYARTRLQKTWKDKNYTNIVKILTSIENHLMPSERKKLEYAKKMISQTYASGSVIK